MEVEQGVALSAEALAFKPTYSLWRHGGWYVHGVRYSSGACGCVSRNYQDGKWRIACDTRRTGGLGEEGDFTYGSRHEAARAEFDLARSMDS